MTGFDASAFLSPDPASVATAGDTFAAAGPAPKPTETNDIWQVEPESVATVAAVATICELTGDKPYAAELNRVFTDAGSARFQGEAWRRFCLGVHAFSDAHAAACLEAGWSPREIWGVGKGAFLSDDGPAFTARSLLSIGTAGLALTIGRREVVEIRAEWVRFKAARLGTLQRYMRDHNRINTAPHGYRLLWEVPFF